MPGPAADVTPVGAIVVVVETTDPFPFMAAGAEPEGVVVVVVAGEFGGVVIEPGESMGTMNLPGGIKAGFG